MVNEKEKEKENIFSDIQCLFSHKIKTILDSGANETMINDLSFAKALEQQKTGIQTAGRNTRIEQGVWGTLTHTSFPLSGKRATFGQNNRAVFCENISENLSSVGRLCENNYIVIFILTNAKYFQREILEWGGNVYTLRAGIHKPDSTLLHSTQIHTHNNTHTVHRKGGVYPCLGGW